MTLGIAIALAIFGFVVGYSLMTIARRITALERRLEEKWPTPVYQGGGRVLDLDRLLAERDDRIKKEIAGNFGAYSRRHDQLRG